MEQNLISYGLSPRETKIYLFLLQNKDVSITYIGKALSYPRATIYKTLDELKRKNLVSSWTKNGIRHYIAENPKTLEKTATEKMEKIKEILPDLSKLFGSNIKNPKVLLYEGETGIKNAYEILLNKLEGNKNGRIYIYSDGELIPQFPRFFKEWRKRRLKINATSQIIVPKSFLNSPDYSNDGFRETRAIEGESPIEGTFNICDSLVIFFSYQDSNMYSVIIDSPIIAKMMLGIFKYVWNGLPSGKKE